MDSHLNLEEPHIALYPRRLSPFLSPYTLITSMLFEVVLPLETLSAHLTTEREFGTLVRPLVDHEVVGLGEPPLAVLAHELALGPHLSPKLIPGDVVINLHDGEHLEPFLNQPNLRSNVCVWIGL